MVLSDVSILEVIKQHPLITPFDEEQLEAASYDLRLGDHYITYHTKYPVSRPVGIKDQLSMLEYKNRQQFVIEPLDFALATTVEFLDIPNYLAAKLEGKSSLGRIGLFIHITAGFIDPGFRGTLTIEMFNASPVPRMLHKGDRIAQVAFYRLEKPALIPYGDPRRNSHYQNQTTTRT